MSQESTEVVVLRGVDFSETSRIVTFLSPDRGRLTCIAKGAKRPRNPLGGLLDTFNHLEIGYYWKESRGVQTLAEASLINSYSGIKTDLEKMTYSAFPLELAAKVAHENEPSQALFRVLVQGFDSLNSWTGNVAAHCCWQVVHLLGAAGFAPILDRCMHCGKDFQGEGGFSKEGGLTCRRCPRDYAVSAEEVHAFRKMAETDECPSVKHIGNALMVLRGYSAWQLDTDFRSVRVINQVLG